MKKFTLSVIHFAIALLVLVFMVSRLDGQGYPNANTPLEMVPYRLVPSDDLQCNIEIEIIEPASFNNMVEVYSDEIREILRERIVFEIVNPHSASEMFIIDERYYYLIRLPNTGELWHRPYLRSDWR